MWEDRLWENSWLVVGGKRLQSESFQQNVQKQISRSQRDFLQTFLINNVELFSVPTFFGSFWKSWREGPKYLTMSWSVLPPHLMKTSSSLNFKRIGTTLLISDWRTWLWNWNLSKVVITKLTLSKKNKKRAQRRDKSGWRNDGGGGTRGSSSSRYSCKQHFAFIFFECWSVHQ